MDDHIFGKRVKHIRSSDEPDRALCGFKGTGTVVFAKPTCKHCFRMSERIRKYLSDEGKLALLAKLAEVIVKDIEPPRGANGGYTMTFNQGRALATDHIARAIGMILDGWGESLLYLRDDWKAEDR